MENGLRVGSVWKKISDSNSIYFESCPAWTAWPILLNVQPSCKLVYWFCTSKPKFEIDGRKGARIKKNNLFC